MTSSAPPVRTALPTPSGSSAVATLSRSLMTMTGSINAPIVLHLGSALQVPGPEWPVSLIRRHSAADASPLHPNAAAALGTPVLAALLLPQIFPISSVVAPCQPRASAPSVRRRIYETDHLDITIRPDRLGQDRRSQVGSTRRPKSNRSNASTRNRLIRSCRSGCQWPVDRSLARSRPRFPAPSTDS